VHAAADDAAATGEAAAPTAAGLLFALDADAEVALARHLVLLPDVLAGVEAELFPHRLCEYLFELSQSFNQFYQSCPVLQAPSPEARRSRLALCTVVAQVLELNLGLLGIPVLDKM
jgi:arginyl-tRNA synthetase